MYSRKYIRSLPSPQNHPRQDGEREVNLPPDYTGTAFRDPLQSVVRDYPEAVIPDLHTQGTQPPPTDHTQSLLQPEDLPSDPLSEELSETKEASSIADPIGDGEVTQSAPFAEDGETAKEEDLAKDGDPPRQSVPFASEENNTPLLNLAMLRSMTLEDLLLFWMLLMLLCANQEDQIYLLLGLLLFTKR